MKDWKVIAKAAGIDIPDQDLGRISGPLEGIEAAFRPLVATLTPEMEPATDFRVEDEP